VVHSGQQVVEPVKSRGQSGERIRMTRCPLYVIGDFVQDRAVGLRRAQLRGLPVWNKLDSARPISREASGSHPKTDSDLEREVLEFPLYRLPRRMPSQ